MQERLLQSYRLVVVICLLLLETLLKSEKKYKSRFLEGKDQNIKIKVYKCAEKQNKIDKFSTLLWACLR